ncbi:hypothetical protein ACS0TY_020468 [Phlomoides rotata]
MGFFDLNIPYHESDRHATDKSSLRGRRLKLALKAMELGYTGIAYNRSFKGVMSESDRCSTSLFPLTKLTPSSSSSFVASVKLHRELLNVAVSSPFRQYTRLTVIVDIPSQMSSLNAGNPVLRSYDIVAVRPMNQIAFDQACQTSEVDIIAIDFLEKLPFRLKQPMVKAAIKRGVYFEIPYSGLIADAKSRQQMISNCKLLVDWTRGKNLILCSGAPSATELRGPQDVANLFSLLGLSGERAKAAISKNCRFLLANVLRKKHFYKEAVKVEAIPSGEQVNPAKSAFNDWLNWDPISSGEGDLLLDDMEKSFSIPKTVKENVKSINFTSNMNGLPVHGLQIKDLICVTQAALGPRDTDNQALAAMESDAANDFPEDQGGLERLHEELSSTPEIQCEHNNLSKEQGGVILLPEVQTPSSGARNIHLASDTQDSEVSLDYVSNTPLAVLRSTAHSQSCVDDLQDGNHDFEASAQLSLEANRSDDLESNLVTSETKLQDISSLVHTVNTSHNGEGLHISKINRLITDNHVSLEISSSLAINKSTSAAFRLESTMENQCDIDVCAHKGIAMDIVPDKIDIENIHVQPLASSDASSQDVHVEGQYGFKNVTTDSSEPIKDDVMGEKMQIDEDIISEGMGKSLAGRRRRKRKRNSPHQPFLVPFKHLLKSRHSKRNSLK